MSPFCLFHFLSDCRARFTTAPRTFSFRQKLLPGANPILSPGMSLARFEVATRRSFSVDIVIPAWLSFHENGMLLSPIYMTNLSAIKPTNKPRLMDLVEQAGLDVSDWAESRGGKALAARNPKFCYNWSFVKPDKTVILNVWHDNMGERTDGVIFFHNNYRTFAGLRKGLERTRALNADKAVQTALDDKLPIRVVVLGGRRRDINNPGEEASEVTKRLLDPVS